MTRTQQLSLAAVLVALVAGSAVLSASAAGTKSPTLKLRKTSLGTIIVDSHGHSLYAFGHDLKNKSRCSGACASNWPPAKSPAHPTVGKGIDKSKLKVIRRSDGSRQLSYNGHPLYDFIADSKAGDVNGQGLNEFGGTWHVVNKSGKPVTHAPSSGSSTSSTPAPAPSPYPYPY
jgi:predicted lipoprotein with Yx(FWY)xxD motif